MNIDLYIRLLELEVARLEKDRQALHDQIFALKSPEAAKELKTFTQAAIDYKPWLQSEASKPGQTEVPDEAVFYGFNISVPMP